MNDDISDDRKIFNLENLCGDLIAKINYEKYRNYNNVAMYEDKIKDLESQLQCTTEALKIVQEDYKDIESKLAVAVEALEKIREIKRCS